MSEKDEFQLVRSLYSLYINFHLVTHEAVVYKSKISVKTSFKKCKYGY